MARFYNIAPGQERIAEGLRVRVNPDGEDVYMSGKWLGLAEHHGVVFVEAGKRATFRRPDGKELFLGDFPAYVVFGKGKKKRASAAMFDFRQFEGGEIAVS